MYGWMNMEWIDGWMVKYFMCITHRREKDLASYLRNEILRRDIHWWWSQQFFSFYYFHFHFICTVCVPVSVYWMLLTKYFYKKKICRFAESQIGIIALSSIFLKNFFPSKNLGIIWYAIPTMFTFYSNESKYIVLFLINYELYLCKRILVQSVTLRCITAKWQIRKFHKQSWSNIFL